MSYTLTSSAELMPNFLLSDVLAPEAKFQALQTQDGSSLLFSIGTDGACYITRQVPGTSTGWVRSDVSSALAAGMKCTNFAAAQWVSGAPAAIHLAMVLSDGPNDHLYLSLANSDSDTSWAGAPAWTPYPFDDPGHPMPRLKIVNVFLSEASDHEYIVADVLRDPASPKPLLFRYYIDPAKAGGYAWHPHDLAIDLEPSGYTSCLGRKAGQRLDGLYTAGQVSGQAQLIYQPLYNPFGTTMPPAGRFSLPGGLVADTIAACRKADNTSDLYLTSGSGLYYLPSGGQQDGAVAAHLLDSPLFDRVSVLFAAPLSGSGMIVWGLNASNQIFYTTCPGDLAAGSWSVPLPIVTGAEQVSPYLDRANDANTFFCHTGANRLTKAVKSPDTTLWAFSDITLEPPDPATPARGVSSYTTRVQVTDDSDGQPACNVPVTVTSTKLTGVYINYLYYVVGQRPVQVMTGDDGSITVVEPVDTLAGARLTVNAGGSTLDINPMDNAFRKAASLTTPQALTGAVITSPDGTTRPLVAPGTSQADLQAVADANSALGKAYDGLQAPAAPRNAAPRNAAPRNAAPRNAGAVTAASLGSVVADAGDLISSVYHQAADAVQVLFDPVAGVYNLVVSIGGQYYHCALDRIETVVAGIGELISTIVKFVQDVIAFLEFLLEWGDITRTKDVLKNMIKVFLTYETGQLTTLRTELDQQITAAEQTMAGWAGHSDWTGLGADATSTTGAMSSSGSAPNAPGSMLSYHYQNNAQGTTLQGKAPQVTPPGPSDALTQALQREGDALYATLSRLLDLAVRLPGMTVQDILTELAGIVGEAMLESARSVLDAALDLIQDMATAAIELLDMPIHIPVVSDVLNFFGVADFSFLDIICWMSAIPGTLLYKAATQSAPFPDDAQTAFLISVKDYAELLAAYSAQPAAPARAAASLAAPLAMAPPPDQNGTERAIHLTGHLMAGVCDVANACVMVFEAPAPAGNPLSKWTGCLAIVGGASSGVASYVANKLVPNNAIRNQGMSIFNDLLVGYRIYQRFMGAATGLVEGQLLPSGGYALGPLRVTTQRGESALIDMAVGLVQLIPVVWHCVELSQVSESRSKSIAVVDEVSNITAIIGRCCYFAAVNSAPPVNQTWTKWVTRSGVCAGDLQISEALLIL